MEGRRGRSSGSGAWVLLLSMGATSLAIVAVTLLSGNGEFAGFFAEFLLFFAAAIAVGQLRRRGRISVVASQGLLLVLVAAFVLVIRVL